MSALLPVEAATARTPSLDGLRGLAALSVLNLHLLSVFVGTAYSQYAWLDRIYPMLERIPISALWGGQAVILFFILSGFALHRMIQARPGGDYGSYAARRVIRLWVPYAVAMAAASLSISVFGNHKIAGQSEWLNAFLGWSLSWVTILQHALMIDTFNTKQLDFVIWSLVHELRISLIFPLIYWAIERWRTRWVLIGSVLAGAAGTLLARSAPQEVSIYASLGFQTYFVIGACLSKHEAKVVKYYRELPRAAKVLGYVAIAVLYCNSFHLSSTYCIMLGATGIFIVALCSPSAENFLRRAPVQWLGKISYSLYLMHPVVLLAMINWLYPSWSFTWIVGASIPAIIGAAIGLNYFVELPSIALSRTAGNWLRNRQAVPATIASNRR